MAVTTATLGGVTLPDVADDGFDEAYGYRGADREMLDGSVHTALVSIVTAGVLANMAAQASRTGAR